MTVKNKAIVGEVKTLSCSNSFRNYHFLKITTEDGIVGWSQFFRIQMPLILPTIGIVSILTFVGTFQGFELVYVSQTAMAGPNFSTDLLGTFLFRTFFGVQLQAGDLSMGATLATVIFLIILICVAIYLAFVQSRLRRYQF